ncbi:MAG TPA: hypothetical protein VG841_09890 [Caulobacterales bacterium]|nr:hypothetical protein [Caulobacterales bacterium]
MSPFEFFFSLFGLVLGLAVATVIGGLSDVLRQRGQIRIGWLTPMLALFVLFDLSTMWVNAWTGLSDIKVTIGPFFMGLIVAGIYYFAASMVFPKTAADWPSLDDYYMGHRRYVLGGVVAANLALDAMDAIANRNWALVLRIFTRSEVSLLFTVTLAALFIFSNKRVQYVGLAALLAACVYGLVVFWSR